MPRLGTPGRGPRASTGTTRSEPPRRAASLPTSSRGGPRAPRRLRTGGRPGRGPGRATPGRSEGGPPVSQEHAEGLGQAHGHPPDNLLEGGSPVGFRVLRVPARKEGGGLAQAGLFPENSSPDDLDHPDVHHEGEAVLHRESVRAVGEDIRTDLAHFSLDQVVRAVAAEGAPEAAAAKLLA